MAGIGNPNATGRSSGKLNGRQQKILGPPEGEPWIFLLTELLASTAWKAAGINARRLIDFLLIEHRLHSGLENGKLKATYDQLEAFGIPRKYILGAIEKAEALGLVRAKRCGMRVPSEYRLTFFAAHDWSPPTNDWKRITDDEAATHRKEKAEQKLARERRRKKRNAGSQMLTRTGVPLSTANPVVEKPAKSETAENGQSCFGVSGSHLSTPLYISPPCGAVSKLDDPARLGSLVQEARAAKGWTQKHAADVLGISPSWLSNIESGRYPAGEELRSKIVDALDLGRSVTSDRTSAF